MTMTTTRSNDCEKKMLLAISHLRIKELVYDLPLAYWYRRKYDKFINGIVEYLGLYP